MNRYIIITIFCLLTLSSFAQKLDQQKMEKDLKVAQTVLNSMVNEDRSMHWSNDHNDKQTQYIEDYGVILFLPKSHPFAFNFAPKMPPMPDISKAIAKSFEVIEDIQIQVEDGEMDAEARAELEAEREERRAELQERQAELEERAAIAMERAQFKIEQMDSMRSEKVNENTDIVIDFLLDYGHLINQLKDSDKILVLEKGDQMLRFQNDPERLEGMKINRLSVEATVRDIRAFQNNEIDREEAESRIVISKKKEAKPLSKDVTLFKTIIKRLYARDLSETYFLRGEMQHEQIDELGIIFYMDFVSSTKSSQEGWNVPTRGKEELNQEERDNLIKSIYPEFEAEIKNNILEYGKNISSLGDEDQLIFKIGITKCDGCEIPESIEIQVKSQTLEGLKSGELNKNEAVKKLKVTKGQLQ